MHTFLVTAALALAAAGAEEGERPAKADEPYTLVVAGGSHGDGLTPALQRLRARLGNLEPKSSMVIFTGNYSKGPLPAQNDESRAEAEKAIAAHVEATRDYVKRGGKVSYLAGPNDFPNGGSAAVHRLRRFLNQAYAEADDEDGDERAKAASEPIDVMPRAGCGDQVVVEVNKKLTLLFVDSQWWMQDAPVDEEVNEGCEVSTRTWLDLELGINLNSNRAKRLVVLSHHPMRSYGPFGGEFTAAAHADPVPVVGSAVVLAKQAGLIEQYANHPLMRSYSDLLERSAQRYGSYLFVSGHDASLQALKVRSQTQLITGTSAVKGEPTTTPDQGDFAAGAPGWLELTVAKSGSTEATFFSGDEDQKVLFTEHVPDLPKPADVPDGPPAPMPPSPFLSTYTKTHVWELGPLKLLAGSFYAGAYQLKLPFDVLDLSTEQGGLTPKHPGGGQQTNSLVVVDSNGGEWGLRAITKQAACSLPWPQNRARFLTRAVEHGYSAIHPEAPMAVARLATAMGVLHSEPRLLYLPDQAGLGEFRGLMGDEVVLLERRPKAPHEGTLPVSIAGEPSEAGKTTFKSTIDTIEKVTGKPWKHAIDQEAMLRARLLDILVGDWDRHEDQWKFAVTPTGKGDKIYRPIARDRDQALASYDGAAFFLARLLSPNVRVLQPFTGDYPNLSWLTYNARNIDPTFLNQIPHDRWLAIANEAKASLTDDVIAEALSTWHTEAYGLDGARVAKTLRARRDKLTEAAEAFYDHVNRFAEVTGSRHDDTFDLFFEDAGAVHVVIQANGKKHPYFDRVYKPRETDELRLFALEGDDTLVVHGEPKTEMEIRFVGGLGDDSVKAEPGGQSAVDARVIRFYDSEKGASIDPTVTVTDERSDHAELNQYARSENHEPNYALASPQIIVNPDVGAYIGARYGYTVQGYKKLPFAARHEIGAAFATATLGLAVDYHGLFPRSVGLLDQQLEASAQTPGYTRNFFGLTNEYMPFDSRSTYYRLLQARYEARYGLSYAFGGQRTRVGANVFGQITVTENTEGRYVSVAPDVTPAALGPRTFGGVRLFAETNTYDDLVLPTQGVALHASVEGRRDIGRGEEMSLTCKGAAALAIPFDRQRRVVLITRAVVEGIIGPHPFYLAPTLGGVNLRAYHYNQLAGDLAFAQTTDLRIDILRFTRGLPGSAGINLSIDHGRVFGTAIGSHVYHVNYGGGLWWSVLDLVGVSLNYYRSLEGADRVIFAIGPLFSQTGFQNQVRQ